MLFEVKFIGARNLGEGLITSHANLPEFLVSEAASRAPELYSGVGDNLLPPFLCSTGVPLISCEHGREETPFLTRK